MVFHAHQLSQKYPCLLTSIDFLFAPAIFQALDFAMQLFEFAEVCTNDEPWSTCDKCPQIRSISLRSTNLLGQSLCSFVKHVKRTHLKLQILHNVFVGTLPLSLWLHMLPPQTS